MYSVSKKYLIDCNLLIFLIISGVVYDGIKKCEKRLKNVAEKFGSKEKSRTFALPFEKRVADKAESSLQDWRLKIKNEKFLRKNLEIKK